MIQVAGTPQYIRNLNENLIIDALIAHGMLSRADISRQTGLSKPTVSSAVEHLIARNLVLETGRADNAQGRKATLIRFNEQAYYICGVDIGASRIRIALSNLNGELLDYQTYPMSVQQSESGQGERILQTLRKHLDELLRQNHLNWDEIQCIGFGIPGVVLPGSGEISRIVAPLAGLEQALSLESLSAAFPCEVILDNDVNLAALGEYRDGSASDSELFVFISLGVGTGAGIMVNGQLLRGMRGLTGEVAEMMQEGRRLEDVLSAGGLIEMAANLLDEAQLQHNDSRILELRSQLTPEKLFEAARLGNSYAVEIIRKYCHMLALALRNISVLLAPHLIVLGGGIGGNGDVLLPYLKEMINKPYPAQPELICSKLEERAVVTGAVHIALQQTMLRLQQETAE
ncbi:ROK family transcriptional regulator [Paenibacillus sp. DCT19]|uniref:ROK family transcriptional regulator n=1 Tax=Paenibacillus sp. DCT19 TaxID=2211212 RepID=UPI000FE2407F|nr:ROK family transcriptional regulator [Paenibacillus sp. DCT19]